MNPTVNTTEFPRPVLGVSACLLGEAVRYDGGHKRHDFIAEVLARHVDYIPLCPEAGTGMGIPRPPIQLVGEPARPHARGVRDPSVDVTEQLHQYASDRLAQLQRASGYLFKKDSPSCGLRRVKLFASPGRHMRRRGTGIFAGAVTAALPLLPVEEEDALDDPRRRYQFLCRLFVYRRWQALCNAGAGNGALQAFHDAHVHLVMAHSRAAAQRLARLLAAAGECNAGTTTAQHYIRELLTALALPDTAARHSAAQQSLAEHLAPQLTGPQRATLTARLRAYREGRAPLETALAALREAASLQAADCLTGSAYLYPFPDSLRGQLTREDSGQILN
jgi:uncharacterized protein YbbK (DUF523 family)/uncharacterized protein YbgA (DUF1722 family)